VVVHDFNIKGVSLFPNEANSPLIVDADTVPPLTVSLQGFKPIPLNSSQVSQLPRGIKHSQLPKSYPLDGSKPPHRLAIEEVLGIR
jgi:hypothetical protein